MKNKYHEEDVELNIGDEGGRERTKRGEGGERGGGVTRSYKEEANSNRPIGPYKAVWYLT